MSLLQEAVSAVVFHATSLRSAISIVEKDRFELSADFAKAAEQMFKTEPMFYLSTTRSRLGAYHVDSSNYVSNYTVLFVLDGMKLNNTYKGVAVDYWQMTTDLGIPMKDEMEDRVFSRTREISMSRYVKRIDILLREENGSFARNDVLFFYNLCKRKGIPVKIFDNTKSFLLGRGEVSDDAIGGVIKKSSTVDGFTGYSDSNRRYKSSRPDTLTQLIMIDKFLSLGKPIPKEYLDIITGPYGYSRDYYKKEVADRVKNDMHNLTRKPVMADFSKLLRKYKTYDIRDLLDAITDRVQGELT